LQFLGHPLDLAPRQRLGGGGELGPEVAGADREPKTSPGTEDAMEPRTSFMVEMSTAILSVRSVRLIVRVGTPASRAWRAV
jgi:hypothetical protein